MSVQHVLFIVTNTAEIGPRKRPTGFFFPEIAHPFEAFDQAGIAIEYVTLLGGKPHEDSYDEKDSAQSAFRQSLSYKRMGRSRKLSEVDVLDYDAIFIPGGLGPMVDIARNPEVQRAIARAWEAEMVVAAVCHGPCAFLGVKLEDGSSLINGRRLTAFSNAEEDGYASDDVPFALETALVDEGAKYESTASWQPNVVVDGRLMTGQNPASAGPLAAAMVEVLQKDKR
ncbi:type 1 glutamine amidotransferase domain-containing protein [Burkholderia sp. Bp9143]|nr:type 1 glutamine amidotransferase domain-containing protein [Burkholderia sp. Bp9143]